MIKQVVVHLFWTLLFSLIRLQVLHGIALNMIPVRDSLQRQVVLRAENERWLN